MKLPSKYGQDKINSKKIGSYDFRVVARDKKRRICPFKIKLTLPEQKTVNIVKNGQVVKAIDVTRTSKYFSGRSTLVF